MAFSFPLDGPGSAFRSLAQFLNIVRTHQDRSAAVMLSPASKVVYYALMATGLSAPPLAAAAESEDEVEHSQEPWYEIASLAPTDKRGLLPPLLCFRVLH